MVHIIGQALLGLVVGIVAKLLLPGRDPGGIIVTALIGLAGGFAGGWLGRAVGLYREGQAAGFVMSVLGAMALLLVYRLVV